MKRYVLFISLLLLPIVYSFGQHNTMTFSGNVTSTRTWNAYDTVYITGDVYIGTGVTLTIAPNTTGSNAGNDTRVYIVFRGDYWINISGTGGLNVSGTSSINIYFTADRNNNHVFGESGEVWQNISFDISTGTSVIDRAVIEYGTGDSYGYGGGIDIYGGNITVRNSTIRNCNMSGGDGGGIYAFPSGGLITLQNLILHNNTATGNGGGLYIDGTVSTTGCEIYGNSANGNGDGLYLNTSATVSNSRIYNQSSGDGVYINATNGSLSNCLVYGNNVGVYLAVPGIVVNSDVVNNTTGVTSNSFTRPKIVNTILWGNGTQYTIMSGAGLELAYCGIQGGLSGGFDGGHNVNLSATNGADTGPNFVNTSTPDLHINSWITPNVDGGTSTYTGVTIPGTDIEGRSRLSTIDIGAYEFIYYIWTGAASTTSWTTPGNWTGSPASIPTTISDNKVVIPKGCSYYPTTSTLTLSSRSTLTLESQAGLTVTGATTVDAGCTFFLKSDATGSANFITGSDLSGSFNVELFLAGGGSPNYRWHYVMTPVNSYSKAVLTTNIGNSYNLLNYVESAVVSMDRNQGWQWHDGFAETTGFNTLYNTTGYNVYVTSDQTAHFAGTILNSQDFGWSNSVLTCGTVDPGVNGWNFIGNPFTSGVDVESFTLGANIESTIYFTKDNGYLYYNVATHTGTNGATNIIPAMQGFFVHANSSSGRFKTVTIPASSRLYSTYALHKKGGSLQSHDFPYLKLNVSDGASLTDETVVYFFNDASAAFDGTYDAYKMLAENPAYPQLYTSSGNIKFAMNGLPFPDKIIEVPLKVRIGEAKNYTINILNLENLADYKVTLVHGDKRIDLKTNPSYSFYAAAGTIDNMSLIFEMPLSVEVPLKDQTSCWYSNGAILMKTGQSGFEDNSTVIVYDLIGKVVYRKNNIRIGAGEIVEIPVSLNNGIYITTINNRNKKLSKKIVISR